MSIAFGSEEMYTASDQTASSTSHGSRRSYDKHRKLTKPLPTSIVSRYMNAECLENSLLIDESSSGSPVASTGGAFSQTCSNETCSH